MTFGALSGFTVAVTADRRADEQIELLHLRGASTVHAPVIRTLPLLEEGGMREATASIISAPPDILVVCTAVGMQGWCSAVQSVGTLDHLLGALRDTHVMVRGPKAAGAAHAAGIHVGWTGEGATYSEVVRRLTAQRNTTADGRALRLAVVLDGAESEPVVSAAREHGYDVIPVPVYRWGLPTDTAAARRVVAGVGERSVDAVTFTSAPAVDNFFEIVERDDARAPVLDAFNVGAVIPAAVGPVTGGRMRSHGVRFAVEPSSPRLGAMVQALASSFDDRSQVLMYEGHPIQIQGRLVCIDGAEVASLTDRERAVLRVLAERRGAVVSKRALMAEVWGEMGDEHVVEVTVARLRRRLGPVGQSIETVVRRGYRLAIDRPSGTGGSLPPPGGPNPARMV